MELHYSQHTNGMYILGKDDIEHIATDVLREHFPMNLEHPVPLETGKLLEDLGLLVKHKYLGIPGHEILGAIIMEDSEQLVGCSIRMDPIILDETLGTVLINSELCSAKNAPRRRYTEAHEASHWLLHRPYFDRLPQGGQLRYVACRSVENYMRAKKTDHDWLEWQADSLSAALLMPRDVFFEHARSAIRSAGAKRGYLTEGKAYDRGVFYEIIGPISKCFFVSHRAAQIRMLHLGLIRTALNY